ncbi:MAG: hypothetical protein KDD67_11110 [Ignavibacteriae bacterium]|nr:hypothetical protein [Ignavibacteriota bacterium]MCB9215837.1 hypothetical protein [Ignavibacteria bacterium]
MNTNLLTTLGLLLATASLGLSTIAGCTDANGGNASQAKKEEKVMPDDSKKPGGEFSAYWYQGVAELNRYELSQARYGEVHRGDAVLIFVTEDFLADTQVKLESDKGDRVAPSVLKVNFVKKFLTGIYPYSMMTSVFTPVDLKNWPHSLKVTTSSQEWCGHTFTQLNWLDPEYRLRQFSYFEKEGDIEREVTPDLLEDEVWTRLRIDPTSLPVGRVNILPGTMSTRLRHTENVPNEAEVSFMDIAPDKEGKRIRRYILEYTNPARTLMVDYRVEFPHEIVGWSETYSDFGTVLTTTAKRTNVLRTNYWSKHSNADSVLRKELGLH